MMAINIHITGICSCLISILILIYVNEMLNKRPHMSAQLFFFFIIFFQKYDVLSNTTQQYHSLRELANCVESTMENIHRSVITL